MHLSSITLAAIGLGCLASASASTPVTAIKARGRLQDIVTWDQHSISVHGERLFIYSGEFHPFRLPVPGLWLDVLQKIKALGFTGVSFYVDWGLVEGKQGTVNLDGIFGLEEFFAAASEAGLYVIARPGPYINAEVASGGMPGWSLRLNCTLRSDCAEYVTSTQPYIKAVGEAIAAAQITRGGPVILVQPENEYSTWPDLTAAEFPSSGNRAYMAAVEQALRDTGIDVPFMNNDNAVQGYWAPGTGEGAVDIYAIDAYPMRYDCSQPDVWPLIRWPEGWQAKHAAQSPSTPFAIAEFQGGSGTNFGGVSQSGCGALVGPAALRVVYKNNYSFGVKLLNVYMAYGGSNWGNLGYQGGDSSYDYGAAIDEFRQVSREKYSEQKLQANFFKVSPAYLTSVAGNATNGTFASTVDVAATPLYDSASDSSFFVVRHASWSSTTNVSYSLTLPISSLNKNVTIPQLGGSLSLLGRDSKLMVTDYNIGGLNLVYSTADIFTWAGSSTAKKNKSVLILYGTEGEQHEFALPKSVGKPSAHTSRTVESQTVNGLQVVQWTVTREPQTVFFNNGLEVRLLWRNDAYNYWVLELPAAAPIGNFSSPSKQHVIVKGGYLLRSAHIDKHTLFVSGDFNTTTPLEVVYEPTGKVSTIYVNGKVLKNKDSVKYVKPTLDLPDLVSLDWKSIDSLPELAADYDDSLWVDCDLVKSTNNQINPLRTPASLFASDYGFHSGSLLYRGYFVSTGQESSVSLNVSGGNSFAYSAWLNSTLVASYTGNSSIQFLAQTPSLPVLEKGSPYVLTILIDHMGQDEEAPGTDAIKFPKGLLDISLSNSTAVIDWKMTGNFGGEDYPDKVRGPRNEGASFAERQAYHLPGAPTSGWTSKNPFGDGVSTAGLSFFSSNFPLDLPAGYDIPLSLSFRNNSAGYDPSRAYRVHLFVNGYQFGKFIPYMGPVFAFAVPEGIFNYHGDNYIGLLVWTFGNETVKVGDLSLQPQSVIQTGMQAPALAPMSSWTKRDAY